MNLNRYNYGFVRRDLPEVQRIIQWGHAVQGATLQEADPNLIVDTMGVNHTVLFEVENERELIDVSRELERENIAFYTFFEPDYDLGYTALATHSITGADREFFSRYRKYGSPEASAMQPVAT